MISIRTLLPLTLLMAACAAEPSDDEEDGEPDGIAEGALNEHPSPRVTGYEDPTLSADEKTEVLSHYATIDPNHVAPKKLLEHALVFFDHNKAKIDNQNWIVIVDFTEHSKEERFFVVDMHSGKVEPHVVAHGKGSDPRDTGTATSFSNLYDSNKSSLGFYRTAETYNGKHGRSLKMDGLSDTNYLVRDRQVVIHGATYVSKGRAKQGRSEGCFALPQNEKDKVIDKLIGGAIIYAGTTD